MGSFPHTWNQTCDSDTKCQLPHYVTSGDIQISPAALSYDAKFS